ncbi:DNA polymerase III subunit beta [Gloeobacter kilaueensis]|uniref:Beta sliding clamp n=1 Tax=Gloeobacter kilaueensis (strain ATCC BAA-2537 / CCAP 1431/1 / ULC 316 / JS1) TaxID=1183438 RepID=U5QGJ0_GLOK1|nr:DNA polymerase III subunit beta [Gloeobacter kilaueensis]AGY57988.1 DNA polymerase III subunit beta [Gloeobacter kilaueensis JS1]
MFTITTTTAVFARQLATVARIVPSRTNDPILTNVLCRADRSPFPQVTLIGFDLELGIETRFEAGVSAAGTTTLPARLLADILTQLPNEPLTIEVSDTHGIDIRCPSGHYQLQGASAEEFPSLPRIDSTPLVLPLPVLQSGFGLTVFSASTEKTKQILNSVCLRGLPDGLEFVAIDGHRLAYRYIELQTPVTDITLVLPRRSVRELQKLLVKQNADSVRLLFDEKHMSFQFPKQILTTRLLSGRYPEYPRLLPQSFKITVEADRRTLCSALERIAVIASQKHHICKFELSSSGALTLSVNALDKGQARQTVFVDYAGPEFTIAFNCKYVLEGLKTFDSRKVVLNFNGPDNPAVFSPSGDELHHRYLVMSVSLRNA